ncbi:MAG TPA: low specificity L-threonine aldolase, partial [Planctomycetota bacterium]|nr:low specificity L-threonine aldolase [Planctomycetota bacterium]
IALEEGPALLAADHRRTRALAEALAPLPGVELDPATVETNLLFLTTRGDARTAQARLEERGILAFALGRHRLRFVFHRDVGDEALEAAIAASRAIFG